MATVEEANPVVLRRSVSFLRNDSVGLCRRTDREDIWVLPGETPPGGEGTQAQAQQEVAKERDMQLAAERAAFALGTSRWDRVHHRIEMAFLGAERARGTVPTKLGENLEP